MKLDDKCCPKCGSEVASEEVDIGVGTMHRPAYCNECGWSQHQEVDEMLKEFGLGDELSK